MSLFYVTELQIFENKILGWKISAALTVCSWKITLNKKSSPQGKVDSSNKYYCTAVELSTKIFKGAVLSHEILSIFGLENEISTFEQAMTVLNFF